MSEEGTLSDAAVPPPPRKRRLQHDAGGADAGPPAGALPPPSNPGELWRWPTRFGYRLQYNLFQINFFAELISKLLETVHTVSDFSGLGAPELAAHQILAYCQRQVWPDQELEWRFGRASDFSKVCRRALALHAPSPTAPACIMGNQMDRIPKALLEQVRSLYDEGTQKAKDLIAADPGQRSSKDIYNSIGKDVFAAAANLFLEKVSVAIAGAEQVACASADVMHVLSDGVLKQTAYCYTHKQHCPISGASTSGCGLRGCVAGVLCYDWSSRGLKRGLLAFQSSILLIIWMCERLLYQEDWCIVECVPAFDHRVFKYIAHVYELQYVIVCSSLFGAASTRKRKLMFLLKRSALRWHAAVTENIQEAFEHLFMIPAVFNSEIYFSAPKKAVRAHIERHFKNFVCSPTTNIEHQQRSHAITT